MSDSDSHTAPDAQLESLLARVAELPSESVAARDPLRAHYIQALARRLPSATPGVQAVLRMRLAAALADEPQNTEPRSVEPGMGGGGNGASAAKQASGSNERSRPPAPSAPKPAPHGLLGQLNEHIEALGLGESHGLSGLGGPHRDLRSAVRFRETWARLCAETEVEQAHHRAPENAGPLNAHHLVLRMLGLMRELSPDYLRRFLGYSDSLLWLDQAYARLKQPAAKGKAARAKARS
ncbi:MAG: DUF2894 domain-containing protein [Burkholderiaceae bacterium]